MDMVSYRGIAAFAAAAAIATFAAPASADIVNIASDVGNSTEGLGTFTGSIEYNYDSFLDVGNLTVSLTNTGGTDPLQGAGFITGFVFNIGSSDPGALATLVSATHPFLNTPNESAMPFGNPFDAGAALGANWEGGGNPNDGIGGGETGVFEFDVAASDASSLTAMSFLTGGPFDFNFVVRFRGFDGRGSDKVPAIPSPAALAVLGVAGLAARRRR